jgi:dienelactone hydrolase
MTGSAGGGVPAHAEDLGRGEGGGRGRWRAMARWGAGGLALVVAIGMVYAAYIFVRHDRAVATPAPVGPRPIGRTEATWTDSSRPDPLAPVHGSGRRLSVWLWYPAAAPTGAAAAYMPGAWGGIHFPAPVGWGETRFRSVATHAVEGAPAAAGRSPLVVLEPGLGFSAPQYTVLAESLASQGFVVAGVTPSYSANLTVLDGHRVLSSTAGNPPALNQPDLHASRVAPVIDQLLSVWARDALFVARAAADPARTPLAGHVQAGAVDYVGHSFGGAAALEACRLDDRCQAAVDLDGTQFGTVSRSGLDRPFLLVASGSSCIAGTCRGRGGGPDASDQAVATRLLRASNGHGHGSVVPGIEHFDFTDYGIYYLAAPLRVLVTLGPDGGPAFLRRLGQEVGAFLAAS